MAYTWTTALNGQSCCAAPPPQAREPGPGRVRMEGADGTFFQLDTGVHTAFLGATGYGKTTAMLQLQRAVRGTLDAQGGTAFFFDPKLDYCRRLARPDDVILGRTDGWNLYEDLRDGLTPDAAFGEVFARAFDLSSQLFAHRLRPGASNEQYFPQAARDVLAALLTTQTLEALWDPALARGLDHPALLREVNRITPARLKVRFAPYPELEGIRYHLDTREDGSPTGETNGVLSELSMTVRETFLGPWSGPGHFSIRRFIRSRSGQAVFLPYDYAQSASQGACCRVLLDLALKQAQAPDLRPGLAAFVLDELPLLLEQAVPTQLVHTLNAGRSAGVRIYAACQSVGQLRLTGTAAADAILAGFGQMAFFHCNDAASMAYASEHFGTAQLLDYYFDARGQRQARPRTGPAVGQWELADLVPGEAVVSLPGRTPPFRFRFAP